MFPESKNSSPQLGSMAEHFSWVADTERLLFAALQPTGPGPLDCDEVTLEAVKERCLKRFGELVGPSYYFRLIATFPERHKEFFPELYGPNGEDLTEVIPDKDI